MRIGLTAIVVLGTLAAASCEQNARSGRPAGHAPPRAAARDDASVGSLFPAHMDPLGEGASTSQPECLARHREALTTGVAEAIADLGYDRFFEDVCISEHALATRDAEACKAIAVSSLRDGCSMRVAVLAGAPALCPLGAAGRDTLCLAFTTGELAYCETTHARDRVRCRATLANDRRPCRLAGNVPLCEATVARFAPIVASRRTGRAIETKTEILGARRDAPGEVTLTLPDPTGGVRLTADGCAYEARFESSADRFGTRPAVLLLRFVLPTSPSLPLRIPIGELDVRIRARERVLDTTLGAEGAVVVSRFQARRLGRLDLALDVTLRDGDERWRFTGTIETFVRDLDEAHCPTP